MLRQAQPSIKTISDNAGTLLVEFNDDTEAVYQRRHIVGSKVEPGYPTTLNIFVSQGSDTKTLKFSEKMPNTTQTVAQVQAILDSLGSNA